MTIEHPYLTDSEMREICAPLTRSCAIRRWFARNGFANLISDFQELNLGNYLANYTDDDVRRMNDWAINAYTAMKGGE